MTVADIKAMRDRAPFRPFRLHLTNGEILPVEHPDYGSIPPEPDADLFVVWVGIRWNPLEAAQIARISLLDAGGQKPGH